MQLHPDIYAINTQKLGDTVLIICSYRTVHASMIAEKLQISFIIPYLQPRCHIQTHIVAPLPVAPVIHYSLFVIRRYLSRGCAALTPGCDIAPIQGAGGNATDYMGYARTVIHYSLFTNI